jgi:uroporphyrinogen-III synthase
MSGPLTNRRIALAECRELDLLARMLEREGAEIVRCPLVAIRDAPDAAPVEAWIRRVIAGECDDLILYTGEGVRRLVGFAERAGLRDNLVAALGRVNKITRGPKPVRALREIGLSSDLAVKVPTTDGIIAALAGNTTHERSVSVQVYGQEPNLKLVAFLEAHGATVDRSTSLHHTFIPQKPTPTASRRSSASWERGALPRSHSPARPRSGGLPRLPGKPDSPKR